MEVNVKCEIVYYYMQSIWKKEKELSYIFDDTLAQPFASIEAYMTWWLNLFFGEKAEEVSELMTVEDEGIDNFVEKVAGWYKDPTYEEIIDHYENHPEFNFYPLDIENYVDKFFYKPIDRIITVLFPDFVW